MQTPAPLKFYRFTLTHAVEGELVLEHEPIGWNQTGVVTSRSAVYVGLFSEYIVRLRFIAEGYEFIARCEARDGYEAEIALKIDWLDDGDNYYPFFFGQLNLGKSAEDELNFSYPLLPVPGPEFQYRDAHIEPDGLEVRLRNREAVAVAMDKADDLDGNPLPALQPFFTYLHSKSLKLQSAWELPQKPFIFRDVILLGGGLQGNAFSNLGMTLVTQELAESKDVSTYLSSRFGADVLDIFEAEEAGQYEVNLRIKGLTIHFSRGTLATSRYAIRVGWGAELDSSFEEIFNSGTSNGPNQEIVENLDLDITQAVSLALGEKIWVYWRWTGTPTFSVEVIYNLERAEVNVAKVSLAQPTPCRGVLIHEALEQVVRVITGQPGAVQSDYFGRTTSQPQPYAADGCASAYMLTNGLQVRQSETGKQPTFSFRDLFSDLDSIFNIGMGVVQDRVVVEPKRFFFQNVEVARFSWVKGLRREIAQEYINNRLEVGYNKYEFETILSLDDAHTKREFNNHLKKLSGDYTKVSRLVASGYSIEFARRAPLSGNTKKGNNYDNDNFIIALSKTTRLKLKDYGRDEGTPVANRIRLVRFEDIGAVQRMFIIGTQNLDGEYLITSALYAPNDPYMELIISPPLPNTNPGEIGPDSYVEFRLSRFVPEKAENFSEVSGLLYPEDAYNLRILPTRNLYRHSYMFNPAMYRYQDELWRFADGVGNYEVVTDLLNNAGCDELVDFPLKERQDLQPYNNLLPPIFLPIRWTMEVPCDVRTYQFIRGYEDQELRHPYNKYGYISFSPTDDNFISGYIERMEYKAATRTLELQLLERVGAVQTTPPPPPPGNTYGLGYIANFVNSEGQRLGFFGVPGQLDLAALGLVCGAQVVIRFFFNNQIYTETKTIGPITSTSSDCGTNPVYFTDTFATIPGSTQLNGLDMKIRIVSSGQILVFGANANSLLPNP